MRNPTNMFKLILVEENTGKEIQARITKEVLEYMVTQDDMVESLGSILLNLFRGLGGPIGEEMRGDLNDAY